MSTKVHVHLFYGADPRFYRPGDNIGCLYGYHHAESDAFALTYSRDARESKPVRLVRRALKAVLGFDFIHTWRNRAEMSALGRDLDAYRTGMAVSRVDAPVERPQGRRGLIAASARAKRVAAG